MFSKQHVEAMLERARLGENIDLFKEAELFISSEIKLSESTLNELKQHGTVMIDDDGYYLLYESKKHKIIFN